MSIYKDCDIRGIYEKEFDAEEAYKIGRAVGTLKKNNVILVGGDVRISTPILKEKLIQGLTESGSHVIDIGVVSTPMFYYSLKVLEADGGIMVTASHNPAEYNGFKLMFGEMPITEEEIREIERTVQKENFIISPGSYEKRDMYSLYMAYIKNFSAAGKLRIVVDCCDGATSKIVPEILEECGYQVIRLYCGSDGRFPNRNPNPAKYECLHDLAQKVIEEQADFGAAFDGDGDRVVFVDNRGNYVASEYTCAIFARDYLKKERGSVIYDQKSASVVKKTIEKYGGEPVMERSGYGFIKSRFLKLHSLMAGEISGHFFFRELGNDDGLYATLKMGTIIEKEKKSLADMVDEFPRSLITPDLRMFCPYEEQDNWLDKIRSLKMMYPISELDGVRVEFNKGWFLIRKSVTEEAVTIRAEADNRETLEYIYETVCGVLPELSQLDFFSAKP